MNSQNYILNQVKKMREKSFKESDQLTLGQIIEKVEKILESGGDKKAEVVYDFGHFYPTEIDSWRGAYQELALNYTTKGKELEAEEFLKMLKEANGKTFTGYKGGDFLMDLNTPVWVSNYSEACDTAVIDVINDDWRIILITGIREY
jgi:hypothetical protein